MAKAFTHLEVRSAMFKPLPKPKWWRHPVLVTSVIVLLLAAPPIGTRLYFKPGEPSSDEHHFAWNTMKTLMKQAREFHQETGVEITSLTELPGFTEIQEAPHNPAIRPLKITPELYRADDDEGPMIRAEFVDRRRARHIFTLHFNWEHGDSRFWTRWNP
jgi:hypothetical protein